MSKSLTQVRLPVSNKVVSLFKFANAVSIVGGLATAAFHQSKMQRIRRAGELYDECKNLRDQCNVLYMAQVDTDYMSSPFSSWGEPTSVALNALWSSNVEALTILRDGYKAAMDELVTGAAIKIIEENSVVH